MTECGLYRALLIFSEETGLRKKQERERETERGREEYKEGDNRDKERCAELKQEAS